MSDQEAAQPKYPLQLYVWPSKWDLPSLDVQCLVAIFYLQLTVPGRFEIIETVEADVSPTGQLPYLVYEGLHAAAPVSSIIKYVNNLPEVEVSTLGSQEKAKATAYTSYIDQNLGDLILHSFYVMNPNYHALTLLTLTSIMAAPQAYYVPGRLKEMYKPRLEAAGLWNLMDAPEEVDTDVQTPSSRWSQSVKKEFSTQQSAEKIKWSFAREKVIERAGATLSVLSSLLPSTQTSPPSFLLGSPVPTSLDAHLAAHILLILHAPLPNPLLKTLLLERHSELVDHALLVRTIAFPAPPIPLSPSTPTASESIHKRASESISHRNPTPYPPVRVHTKPSVAQALLSVARSARQHGLWKSGKSEEEDLTELEKSAVKSRWMWYTAAALSAVAYMVFYGPKLAVLVADDDGNVYLEQDESEGDVAEEEDEAETEHHDEAE